MSSLDGAPDTVSLEQNHPFSYHFCIKFPRTHWTTSDFSHAISCEGSYPLVVLPVYTLSTSSSLMAGYYIDLRHQLSRSHPPRVSARPHVEGHPRTYCPNPSLHAHPAPNRQHPATQSAPISVLRGKSRSWAGICRRRCSAHMRIQSANTLSRAGGRLS